MKLGGLLEDLVWILRKTSMNECYTLLSIHGNPKNCSFKFFIMPAFTKKLARFRRIGPVSSWIIAHLLYTEWSYLNLKTIL